MSAKFTPGPWEVRPGMEGRSLTIWGPTGYSIAVVPAMTQEGIANAHLMGAADALLAALERLLDDDCPFMCDTDTCECGDNGDGRDDAGNVCEHIQGRRAIARAKGQVVP